MTTSIKRLLGHCLLNICEQVPTAKPALKRWGLRTSQEWFQNRIVRIQMPGGKSIKLAGMAQNYLSFELFWRGAGYYEPITTLLAQELVCTADVFVDVGANVGFYSLVLSSSHPGLRVVAFEPNPKNFELLQANARLNQFEQLACMPMAVSDSSGTAVLYLSPSAMSASLEQDFDPAHCADVKVPTTSLDAYLAQSPLPGRLVIKVDVEGHEAAFFKGAEQTIALRKPEIITEVTLHQENFPISFLKQIGYRFYQITDQGLLPTEELTAVTRGRFRFLNCLLSVQPEEKVAALFRRIQPRVQKIDLTQTSKCVSQELLERFQPRRDKAVPSTALGTGLANAVNRQ
jgi:FkbM family methyltransferase